MSTGQAGMLLHVNGSLVNANLRERLLDAAVPYLAEYRFFFALMSLVNAFS
jgi:hypothetical protein